MTTKAFAINYNLDKLSEAERAQYLRDLSAFVGLDPLLNAFDTLWMPDGYGRRNLVAYARRGTAELLRAMHGITVIMCEDRSTTQEARFMVAGKDKTGRQEFAVGSAPLVGLAGERLSSAVMSASTRANRRLTLQFVGCGILDESEVQDSTANPASEAKPVGSPIVFPAPQVSPNTEPGKDTTKDTTTPYVEPETFEARQTRLRAEANLALQPAPKRKNKKRNTVTLNADITESQQTPTPETAVENMSNPTPRSVEHALDMPKIAAQVSTPTAPAPVPLPAAPVVEAAPAPVQEPVAATSLPTAQATTNGQSFVGNLKDPAFLAAQEKFGEYRKKLAVLASTLTKAGMLPSAGIGGVNNKLKKFAMLQLSVEDVQKFTLEQWDELFEFFDGFANDAPALVAYINKAVGA